MLEMKLNNNELEINVQLYSCKKYNEALSKVKNKLLMERLQDGNIICYEQTTGECILKW